MAVDVNDESCLQSEGHSRVSRVSDWRAWERVSESGELGLSAFTLGKRTGGALRATEVNRRLVSCMGNELTRCVGIEFGSSRRERNFAYICIF